MALCEGNHRLVDSPHTCSPRKEPVMVAGKFFEVSLVVDKWLYIDKCHAKLLQNG